VGATGAVGKQIMRLLKKDITVKQVIVITRSVPEKEYQHFFNEIIIDHGFSLNSNLSWRSLFRTTLTNWMIYTGGCCSVMVSFVAWVAIQRVKLTSKK
jgi:hypothetical protein